MMALFLFKCFYYANVVEGTPDEQAHIGYILYEYQENKIIPVLEDRYQTGIVSEDTGVYGRYLYRLKIEEGNINYLRHPTLYYWIMAHIGGIEFIDETYAYVNILYFRYVNILMVVCGLLITFCMAYNRLCRVTDKVLPHWVFAAASVSVPMFAYVASGVSNDNLVYLGVVLFIAGALRYHEGHVNYTSYWLVGAGFFITMMSKLTAGLILVIALCVIVAADIVKNHKATIFCNRYFWSSVIFYLLVIAYYLAIYSRYGKIMPGLKDYGYEYFLVSSFYVEESERVTMTFMEYIPYYFRNFVYTWTILYGHTFWVNKSGLAECLGYYILALLPVGWIIYSLKKKDKAAPLWAGLYLGLLAAVLLQFKNGWQSFVNNGYVGGYQARYYLVLVPFMAYASGAAFAASQPSKDTRSVRKRMDADRTERARARIKGIIIPAAELAYIALLIYGDIIYYILNAPVKIG